MRHMVLATATRGYVAAGALVTGGAAALLFLVGAPNQLALDGRTAADGILRLLDARSPGERTRAELASIKQKKAVHAAAQPPHERALGKVFPPEGGAPEDQAPALVSPEELLANMGPLGVPTISAPVELPVLDSVLPVNLPVTAVPGLIGGGGATGGLPGGGAGGLPGGAGPPGGATQQNPASPLVTSAVPEPETWLMMILGLFVCGWTMRRTNKRLTYPANGSCEPAC
jgi:hypothetical protein